MSEVVRVILAATAGALVGAYVEPKITPHLPASLVANPNTGKLVHAGIGGSVAGLIWYVTKGKV